MAKRRRGSDSDAALTTPRIDCNTVFVDTSLDTGLAMLVFESDTVADFKKKLVSEHKLCYPEMEIDVHYLKVKHGSRFYRLSDSMLVWSAFHGVKRSWYLWVDASGTPSNQNSGGVGLVASKKMMDVTNVDNNCGDLLSDKNRIQAISMPLPDGGAKTNAVLDMVPCIEFGNSLGNTTDIWNCKETESPAKKKRKMRHTKSVCHDPCSKERDDLSHASSKDIVIPDTLVRGISTADAVKEGMNAEVSVARNDGSVLEGRVAFEGTSVLGIEKRNTLGNTVDSQNPTGSDERKNDTLLESTTITDNPMASQNEYEPGLDIQADYSGVVYAKVPDISVNSTLIKRKRKKVQETIVNIQDASEVEQVLKGKNNKPSTETHKSEEKEEDNFLTLNHDHEDEIPSSYKAGLTQKEASKIRIPSNNKKKIKKMSAHTNLEKSGAEQTDNDISGGPSGLLCLPTHQIPVVTDKEESTMDCQNPIGSDERKNDTFSESIIIPINLVASKEYEPVLDIQADTSEKRKTDKETQNSLGDGHAAIPVVEKENQIVEFLQVGKHTENTVNTGKISKKKRKSKTLTASDVQEDVQLKLRNGSTLDVGHVDAEVSGADRNEADFVMSTQTKQTLEADVSGKRETYKETQNSPGDGHAAFPLVEKENQIVEFLQVEKHTENTVNTCKSSKKKRKSKTLTESDVQEDVQLKLRNGSTLDVAHVDAEVSGADRNESDFVMSTQTKQTLGADASGKRETYKETQNSPGDGHAAFPVVEKENQIVEFLQVEKHTENMMNTCKSSKKKRKSKTLTESDVQEDVQLKLQNGSTLDVAHVDTEVSGADGNEADFVMSTQTKQTLEADSFGKRDTHKETQNSPGYGHATFPVLEKENQIVEFLQVEKDSENTGKRAKMKRKKKIISTSDVQEDAQLKLLNGSSLDVAHVGVEVLVADGNETDSVMSAQTNQALEADAYRKRETDKETQNSPDNGHADIPVLEKENQIVENLQVEKDTENTVNTGKRIKKKRKNKTLTASDVQEDLSVKSQNVGIGSSTEENSIKFVNSVVEGIHVASSQAISHKSKEKLEEKHEIAVYTDDLVRTTENEGEGVNFKQYFVRDHSQDKSGSRGKAKKPNQSDKDKKTLKKSKKNGLSSVNISTEVENSSKLSGDGERQNISCVRKDNGKRKGNLAQNSDLVEVIPNSSRSSRAPENWVQDSITSETLGILSKKPKEFLAGSSLPKKKNASLNKSSSERTEKFPERSGNKMPHFGVNDTIRMGMKTPEKKSLLTMQGSLFQDNSGESSGDDNGTSHSSDSTESSSDSSYTSDHSVGESVSSMDSTRDGSSDAQVTSTGGKGTSKLDSLSAMKNVTLKTILQSSNRYKKVKLLASQNEAYQNDSQSIEFVPDSQQPS